MRGGLISGLVCAPVRSYLNHNQLSGTIPATLGNMTSLQFLCAACQPPTSQRPCVVARRYVLFALRRAGRTRAAPVCSDLNMNQLMNGTIPATLGSLTSLQQLCEARQPFQSTPGVGRGETCRVRCVFAAAEQTRTRSCPAAPQQPRQQPAERHHPGDTGQPDKSVRTVRSPLAHQHSGDTRRR